MQLGKSRFFSIDKSLLFFYGTQSGLQSMKTRFRFLNLLESQVFVKQEQHSKKLPQMFLRSAGDV